MVSKVCPDKAVKSSRAAYLRDVTTGIKQPSGKGQRLIVTQVGSEDGFADGFLYVFLRKKTGDYHDEIEGNRFETWFSSVVNRLPPRSVIVNDNPSYHSRRVEEIPLLSRRKAAIQECVASKATPRHSTMTKKQLLHTKATVKTKFRKHQIHAAPESAGFVVLRLPPCCPQAPSIVSFTP
ncbi:uncharacterized protein [Dermacentor albipictus]|uniref:uncharacterized protein n=1 Tax=Dermacentor albipictus TaxID=60249 RepID=UPI0031FD3D22